ncbi:MAG: response regulator [Planctomycetota bacterium]
MASSLAAGQENRALHPDPSAPTRAFPEPLVYVVDDESAVVDLIRRLCADRGLKVAGFSGAKEFLASVDPGRPGCLVLDLRLPDMTGIDLLEKLRELGTTQTIVFISGYAEVEHAVRAMKMGVHDFLEKPFSNQTILDAILSAVARDAKQREVKAEVDDIGRRVARLTRREHQVMELVVRGLANKSIAAELSLSPKTVEVYRANVMAKMEVGSLAELVRAAMRHRDETASVS